MYVSWMKATVLVNRGTVFSKHAVISRPHAYYLLRILAMLSFSMILCNAIISVIEIDVYLVTV